MNEHFHNHLGLIEVTTKLGGVILKKAELEADFEKVYTKVFQKMVEVEFLGSEDFLEIFGEVGG
ncbi:MAG: hypothetical protein V1944_02490 [Candidatus Aenigmatarchaeota archaeon]